MVNENIINNICNKYENNNNLFEVIMVNNGEEFNNYDDEYIMCLVGYDKNKLFTNDARDNKKFYDEILPGVQNEICSEPTSQPTQDPTSIPTSIPTQDPTIAPTLPTVIPLSCTTRAGPTLKGVGVTSRVSCAVGETLVSCGIRGTQTIGGAKINSNNECIALSNDNTYNFEAQAVCCIFPDGAIIDIKQKESSSGTIVSTQCDNNYILTGCHVYYNNGNYDKIQGSYSGLQSSPQTKSWINTNNICNAQSKTGSTVTAIAQCIQFDTQYTLECNTKAKFTNYANFGTCLNDYTMFGCNTWTASSASLDGYYVQQDKCYVQQDGHAKQYANAICCKLKSALPIRSVRRLIENKKNNKRQLIEYEHDLTSGYSNNSPCMTIEIKLATENLVPTNNKPHVGSNIFLIGKALAAETHGIVVLPGIPEQDDDDMTTTTTTTTTSTTSTTATPIEINDDYEWTVDDTCLDNSQIDENYFPKSVFAPELDAQANVTDNGFSVSIPLHTPKSAVYVFEVDGLPLKISHVCAGDLTVIAVIKQNSELIKEAEAIIVPPNESGKNREKMFNFDVTVRLDSDTEYEIVFKTINSFPAGCDLFTDIDLGSPGHDNTRRRLPDATGHYTYDDFAASASPNSCKLSAGLAKSAAMKTAVDAMCKDSLGGNENKIKAGMFKMRAGQTAIKNHLVRPGSLEVYDENGAEIFREENWPSANIKEPCIAIDEVNGRVFAIGGYDQRYGTAVDKIKVFKFFDINDLSLGGEKVTAIKTWVLDKPRYGSSCLYWHDGTNEWLVVVSGMASTQYEFTDKSKFFDDIRVFQIPQNEIDLANWGNSKSKPDGADVKIANLGVINQRLLLIQNHILYFFGGKTHKVSRDVTSRFDLNDIMSDGNNDASLEVMALAKNKASPMIDETQMNIGTAVTPDIKPCYMIFAGQSYANFAVVDGDAEDGPGLTSDFLQLFCNQATASSGYKDTQVEQRRRLKEENILSLSEFDRLLLQDTKRRRLIGEPQEETEVLIRDYNLNSLDGIWYNFTVKFELCYDNNKQLEIAHENYNNSISSKSENGQEWQDYKNKTEAKILDESKAAYEYWSNGFGDVKIWNLDILNVNYNPNINDTVVCELNTNNEKRRLSAGYNADLSSGPGKQHNSPCVKLNIKLKTENLVPTNTKPDPKSNIYLIGKVLANVTGAMVMVDIPDIDDDDNHRSTTTTTEEPFFYTTLSSTSTTNVPKNTEIPWNINPSCLGEPEFDNTYFPKGTPFAPQLTAKAELTTYGFDIKTDFTTPESVVYVFEVNKLPFKISHTCSNNINIIGGIYKNGEIIQETNIITIPPNESGFNRQKELLFSSTIQLLPGTKYEIGFKTDISINPFPNNCDWNKIDLGDIGHAKVKQNRRRLPDDEGHFTYDDFAASASPNSCQLGAGLARSSAMKTAVAAMCKDSLGSHENRIKAGMFKLRAGQTAIKNHLVRPGSLEVYDENGNRIFYDETWPSVNIKKPCIAIDEVNGRVFSIGGYDQRTGNAVDKIKVFKFFDINDLSLGGETVTAIKTWVLDKPRYGSSCLYWHDDTNEWLVVVSGMSHRDYEFTDKSKFFDDIRVFQIPQNEMDLSNFATKHPDNKKTSSQPDIDKPKKYIATRGVIDSRLLLYEGHILYFFGGKTHKVSRNITSRFDLNSINCINDASLEVMQLAKPKSSPMIDKTEMKVGIKSDGSDDLKDCYMIFGGQTYENFGSVETTSDGEPGLTKDFLQLFCNQQISTNPYHTVKVDRRRLINENIVSLTEYDISMLEMSKRNNRRLIDNKKQEEKTQILITDYHYKLDGIWYDFNVNFELCYDNNDKLREGIEYYKNIIESKMWEEYKIELSSDILTESQIAYSYWSDGFGAVNITDLNIININYQFTPAPTQISHPQRRNARWFNKNIKEKNKKIKWIDGKYDDDDDDDWML